MVIDFHTHAFPDGLAKKAADRLLETVRSADIGFAEEMFASGTGEGLIKSMDAAGADACVLLPVATKPSQPEGINRWSAELAENNPRIIPFGAFYPDGSFEAQLEALAGQGRRGIKLHGDFQNFYADDERMLDIYRRCGEYGLICVLHAGVDPVSPRDIHVTPERMARVLELVPDTKFVLAHLGGVCCEEEAARLLHGAPGLWVDTAYAAGRISAEKLRRLGELYGTDRILFGSDSPWNDPADDIALITEAFSPEDRELILGENARRLLGL